MKKVLAIVVVAVVAAVLLLTGGKKELVILHVNDTHSHFEPIPISSPSAAVPILCAVAL